MIKMKDNMSIGDRMKLKEDKFIKELEKLNKQGLLFWYFGDPINKQLNDKILNQKIKR